jgi:hypothetical protein
MLSCTWEHGRKATNTASQENDVLESKKIVTAKKKTDSKVDTGATKVLGHSTDQITYRK